MKICKNCFSPIEDLRKETRCSICNEPIHKDCAITEGGTSYCDVCYTVKEENSMTNLDFEIPQVIRRSYIETYKACPYKFLMEVIKGLDAGTGSHAKVGIDMHELFQKASEGYINTPQELLKEYKPIFDSYNDEMFEKDLILYNDMNIKQLKDKLWQQCIDSADTLFKILDTLPSKAFALEKTIQFDVGEDLPKVSITMDRIDEVNGNLEMLDWKTGTVMVGKKLSSDLQAPLYIKAVQTHYNRCVSKFTFYYLGENKTRIFYKIDDDNYACMVGKRVYKINLTDSIREVQHIFSQIKKGQFNIPSDTKNMYFTCKTCGFKKQGVCQGADIESWKKHN